MIAALAAETTGSIPPNPGAAAAEAPTDLFGALMALLGALPPPAAEVIPQEVVAEESEAPPAEAEEAALVLAGVAGALASLLTPRPALASEPAPGLAPAIALDPKPALAAEAEAKSAAAAVVAAATPYRPTLVMEALPAAPPIAARAEGPVRSEEPSDEPERDDVSALASPPPRALAPALEASTAVAPQSLAASVSSARAPHASPPAEQRIAAALGQGGITADVLRTQRPDLGLEPVPVDAAPREASAAAPVAVATPPPATSSAQGAAAAEPMARAQAHESARPVTERVVWLAEQGGGSARIELSPPELGPVEIVVRVRGRRVEIHVRAEEAAAQQVVRDCRERLEVALAARDLRMDAFSVNSGASGGSGGGSREAAREGAQHSPGFQRAPGDAAAARNAAREPSSPRAVPNSAIDLRV